MEILFNSNDVIDALGGTVKVARLCGVKPAAVSQWRKGGIPDARIMFLQLAHPEVFQLEDVPIMSS